MEINNLFELIPRDLPEELIEPLVQAKGVRLERIVSFGHCSPAGDWYDQEQDEWVVLIKGEAILQFENGAETTHLRPGDYLRIPAHCRHRVTWTLDETESIWLALHFDQHQGD